MFGLRFLIFFLLSLVIASTGLAADDSIFKTYSTKGSYADVRQDLEDAIINRGYVIDLKGAIGDMLKRTRKDVGSTRKLYKDAQFMIFCSAKLSRASMEADPHNVALCPYAIVVYELVSEPGTVYVRHRKVRTTLSGKPDATLVAIDNLLSDIAREATK